MLPNGDWEANDLRDAVAVAVDAFGPERLVCGSDWPVALLNGDYEKVWRETVRVVHDVAPDDAERLLAGNALRLYGLDARDFAHVLQTFPLIEPEVRDAALDAFRRGAP